jgi:hypothetical protein
MLSPLEKCYLTEVCSKGTCAQGVVNPQKPYCIVYVIVTSSETFGILLVFQSKCSSKKVMSMFGILVYGGDLVDLES